MDYPNHLQVIHTNSTFEEANYYLRVLIRPNNGKYFYKKAQRRFIVLKPMDNVHFPHKSIQQGSKSSKELQRSFPWMEQLFPFMQRYEFTQIEAKDGLLLLAKGITGDGLLGSDSKFAVSSSIVLELEIQKYSKYVNYLTTQQCNTKIPKYQTTQNTQIT